MVKFEYLHTYSNPSNLYQITSMLNARARKAAIKAILAEIAICSKDCICIACRIHQVRCNKFATFEITPCVYNELGDCIYENSSCKNHED